MKLSEATPTIVQLERALAIVAYVVVRHGDVYGPLLDRLEDELKTLKQKASHRSRAHEILGTLQREQKFDAAI